MKQIFKTFILVVALATAGSVAQAQQLKIGYINTAELLQAMPQTAQIDSQLTKLGTEKRETMLAMQTDLQKKFEEYQKAQTTMSETDRAAKEKELSELNQRIQQYQVKSGQEMEAKRNELLTPVLDKAQKAITAVAKAKGYTYVIDSSTQVLLHAPEGDNILSLVKTELGI